MSEENEMTAEQANRNWREALKKHGIIISSRDPDHVAGVIKKKERMIRELAIDAAAKVASKNGCCGEKIARAIRKELLEREEV